MAALTFRKLRKSRYTTSRRSTRRLAVEPLEDRRLLSLLGISLQAPTITYDTTGTVKYNALNHVFQFAKTHALLFSIPDTPDSSDNVYDYPDNNVDVAFQVDSNGNPIVTPNEQDLTVDGTVVTSTGKIYNSPLLTGTITQFGYVVSGDNQAEYDFRFTVTGGSLASDYFSQSDIGVTTVSSFSTFTGSFNTDFSGSADGNIGAIPQIPPPSVTPELTTTPSQTNVTLGTTPVTMTDTADLSGGNNPTGSITFTLYYNGGSTPVDTETVTVNGNGTYSTPAGYTPPTTGGVIGTYQWDASYNTGDSNNVSVSDNNDPSEQVTVSAASPTITTTPSPTTVTLTSTAPAALTDTADLEGGYYPTGTITFTLTYNSAVVYTDHVTVNGDNTYTTAQGDHAGGYTLPTTGTVVGAYQWAAVYSGDTNNGTAQDQGGTAEQVTVSAASPTITTTPSPTTVTLTSTAPAALTDTADLEGGYYPTGTITFTLTYNSAVVYTDHVTVNGDNTYTTAQGDHAGGYTLPTTGTVVGAYQWAAVYSGDTNNGTAQDQGGTAEQVTVSAASPTITTTPSPTTVTLTSTAPAALTDTADLEGGYYPTGTITFTLMYNSAVVYTDHVTVNGDNTYTTAQGDHAGGYTLPTTGTVVGAYQWAAVYSGDTNNGTAQDQGGTAEQVTVSAASPTITTTPSPTTVTLTSTAPAALTDTADLEGGYYPTGTITFTLTYNSAVVYTDHVTVNGDNTYTTAQGDHAGGYTLPTTGTVVGAYQWAAVYSGDTNNGTAQDQGGTAEQVTVSPASPTIITTASSAVTLCTTAATLSDSATVSGGYSPTGTVTFNLYANSAGTGTPLFTDTEPLSGGGATSASYTATGTGTDYWVATYNGDNNNVSVSSGLAAEQVTVGPATPLINTTVSASSVVVGGPISDSATVSGGYSPTGTVTFNLYANSAGTGTPLFTDTEPLSGGGATSASYTATGTGTDYWVATYNGDNNNVSVSSGLAAEQVTVGPATPLINTTVSASSVVVGGPISDSATVSGGYSPTGTVTFNLYANSAGTGTPLFTDTEPLSGGTATSASYTATATATDYWVATYNGNSNNASVGSGAALEPVVVGPASPKIVTTASSAVTLPAGPPGTVTLSDSAVLSGGYLPDGLTSSIAFTLKLGATTVYSTSDTLTGNGTYTASYTLPTTGKVAGTYTWSVSYVGDGNNKAAADQGGTAEQTVVSPASPTITTTPGVVCAAGNGQFATIGFWHNCNGQALINGFNGSCSSKTLGNWLSGTYPHLFGASNPYTGCSLAGLTNAQVASVYENLWTPSGLPKNSYVQAFAVALGLYSTGGLGAYNVGSNGTAFGCANSTTLAVTQILQCVDSNFAPASGLFYGGDQTNTSCANSVLNGINSSGENPGNCTVVCSGTKLVDSATLAGGYHETGTLTFTLESPSNSVVDTETVTVNGNGTYSTPNGYLPSATGTYHWQVVYSGDGNNNAVTSPYTRGAVESRRGQPYDDQHDAQPDLCCAGHDVSDPQGHRGPGRGLHSQRVDYLHAAVAHRRDGGHGDGIGQRQRQLHHAGLYAAEHRHGDGDLPVERHIQWRCQQ